MSSTECTSFASIATAPGADGWSFSAVFPIPLPPDVDKCFYVAHSEASLSLSYIIVFDTIYKPPPTNK